MITRKPTRRPEGGKRPAGRIAGLALLAFVAGAAHWAFWYAPRVHTGAASPADLPRRLLDAEGLEAALWIAYPHQNLGALERQTGDLETYLQSVARLAGVAEPVLPHFGPLRLPPATQMVLGVGEGSREFLVAARVYPLLRLTARLAGRLAGNPLLSGGAADIGGGPAVAAWSDGNWVLSRRPLTEMPAAVGGGEEALALLRLRRPVRWLPSGLYRLTRERDGLEVRLGEEPEATTEGIDPLPPGSAALLVEARSGGFRALALSAPEREGAWPRMASLERGAVERWKLPLESLLGRLVGSVERGRYGSWQVTALSRRELALGEAAARRLDAVLPPEGSGRAVLAAWLDGRAVHELVAGVARALEEIPVVGRRYAPRWWELERVLRPLAMAARIEIGVWRQPAAVRVRFLRSATSALPAARRD